MPTTRAPEVIEYLRTQFDAVTSDEVTVYVGPPSGGDIPSQYVAVAYGGEDRPAWAGRREDDPGSNPGEHEQESLEIWCVVSTASGDQDAMLQYGRTQAIYDALVRAIRNSPRMNGLLPGPGIAELGSFEWYLEEGGNIATAFFSVEVGSNYIA